MESQWAKQNQTSGTRFQSPQPFESACSAPSHVSVLTLPFRLDSSGPLNLVKQILRGLPGNDILLGNERGEINAVAARRIDGTTDIIVVHRTVLIDC